MAEVEDYRPGIAVQEHGSGLWKPSAHRILVLFLGTEKQSNGKAWLLEFKLSGHKVQSELALDKGMKGKPPAGVVQRYRILIHESDSWPRAVSFGAKRPQEIDLPEVATGRLVNFIPQAYPLEFFPLDAPGEWPIADQEALLTLRQRQEEGHVLLEADYHSNQGHEVKVRQKWVRGEKWWREYERHVDGKLDLSARLTDAPPLPKKEVRPAFPFPLRLDPKLRPTLSVTEIDPDFHDILARLRKATGLEFEIDDGLSRHDPRYGDVRFSKVAAWLVMEFVANMEIEDGRWVKTEAGYRLTGESRSLRPAERKPWFWLVLAVVGVAILGGVLWRRRAARKKAL